MSTHDRKTSAMVVGTDGSSSATAALRAAAQAARHAGAPLHIVSAYRATTGYERRRALRRLPAGLDLDYAGHHYAGAHTALEDAEELVLGLGVPVFRHAVKGSVSEALCHVAGQVEADVIVVGNRGVDSRLRALRPPICERVCGQAPCRVEIVDTRAHWPVLAAAGHRDSRWT